MTIAEFFAILGIFVIVWWIGRKVAQALDRYELMKGQRPGGVEHLQNRLEHAASLAGR